MTTTIQLKNYYEFSHILKVILLGNANSGKTAIVERLTKNKFSLLTNPTIGGDVQYHHVIINDKIMIKLQIWDICGQQRFYPLAINFTKGSHVIFMVFDQTDTQSLIDLQTWLLHIKDLIYDPEPLWVIIGNKTDLNGEGSNDNKTVDKENVKQLELLINQIKALNFKHIQCYLTSAKTGENIEKTFHDSVSYYFNTILADSSITPKENKVSLKSERIQTCCAIL